MDKSGTLDLGGNGIANPGDVIHYTFTVENTGNVTLYNVTISDPLVTVVGGPIASMAPGDVDTTTFTATYAITQADIDAGQVYNAALAEGDCEIDAEEPCVDDPGDNTELIPQLPDIEIVKSSVPVSYSVAGQVIKYTFVATNTGNVTLHGVTITDPLPGLSPLVCDQLQRRPRLAPGAALTCTANYTVQLSDIGPGKKVHNEACVTGTANDRYPARIRSRSNDRPASAARGLRRSRRLRRGGRPHQDREHR